MLKEYFAYLLSLLFLFLNYSVIEQYSFLFLSLFPILQNPNIIFSFSHEIEIMAAESQNLCIKVSITWISSFEIPDKPPCCVRKCGTSFFYSRGLALNFYFASSLHNFYSSLGSLFFPHLGGIIFIVHYLYL